jgi:hypothetical protein
MTMVKIKCRWCDDSFPAEFDDFLRRHVQSDHPEHWKEVRSCLRDIEGKLRSFESLANPISRGWDVYEPYEYVELFSESDALAVVSAEALEADL